MLRPGEIFAGDYRVVRELGRGGMGAVYVVEQLSTGKSRALKLMEPRLLSDAKAAERFLLEARAGSRVESEHVVEVIAAGIDRSGEQPVPWLVMELLEGESLEQAIASRGPLPPERAHEILRQLCHALGAAHRAGLVHRDVKPDNVFLARRRSATHELQVKLLDFGIAKVLEPTVGRQGSTTAPMGTPLFMAPEQTRHGAVDARADVWALGLLGYYVLTGKHYWRAANEESAPLTALLVEITVDTIEPPSLRAAAHGRALPAGFDEWFLRCVDRDVERRYANADEAWRGLSGRLSGDAFAETVSSDAIARAAPPSRAREAPRTLGRAAKIALSAGVLALVAGGVAIGWSMRAPPEPPAPAGGGASSAGPPMAALTPRDPDAGAAAPTASDAGVRGDASLPQAESAPPALEERAAAPERARLSAEDRAVQARFAEGARVSCHSWLAAQARPRVRIRVRQWLRADGSRVRWEVQPRSAAQCLALGPGHLRWPATGAARVVDISFTLDRRP